MPRNEEGEFELVLGNRQLLSVFGIVATLLAVFFSMGYIVGRNSTAAVDTGPRTTVSKPLVVDPARTETPVEVIKPSAAESKPTPSRHAETRISESKPPEAVRTPKPEREKPVEQAAADEPQAGQTFLQVVATTRPDAELISETLAKKGFRSIVAPATTPPLFRVLVGPLKDAGAMAQTRTRLEAAGFKDPIVRKY